MFESDKASTINSSWFKQAEVFLVKLQQALWLWHADAVRIKSLQDFLILKFQLLSVAGSWQRCLSHHIVLFVFLYELLAEFAFNEAVVLRHRAILSWTGWTIRS